MKKALTLATLLFGMTAFAQVCQAESTNTHKNETTVMNRSFAFFTVSIRSEAQSTTSLFYLDLQKSAPYNYHFTFHYSARLAEVFDFILRVVCIAYLAFLLKKNFPLLKSQHV